MFGDSPVESTSFLVTTDCKRHEGEAHSQTSELVKDEKEIQTGLSEDFSVQTETSGLNELPLYDVDELATFLRKIYPKLVEELEKFDSTPQVMTRYHLAKEDSGPINLHNIDLKDIQEKIISSLSFSSDGKSVAVAFSIQNHESWCTHTGEICVYKTNSDDYSAFPVKCVLKTNSCVNHVSFHPSLPSHLGCGLFNGQVSVWNLVPEKVEKSFDQVHASDLRHSDAVTSVSWLLNWELFVSSGRDGNIIFWNYDMMKLTTNCCYFISSKYTNPEKNLADHAEILCIGMWNSNDSIQFIVGTEGGNILHCSNSENEISKIPHRPGFFDPFVMKYEPYDGIITSVACCGKDVFATCGTNNEIRVYRARKKLPFHVIYTNFQVLEIDWFEGSSKLIACWGYGQNLYFNNIMTKDWLKSFSIRLQNPDSNITAVAFSQNRSNVIALGTDKSEVSIWMVPNLSYMNKLASVSLQNEQNNMLN